MDSFFAQSPSNPESFHEIAYIVIFSIAILTVIITMTFVSYLCTTRVFFQTQPSQQSTSTEPQEVSKQGLDEATIATYPKLLYSEVKLNFGSSSSTSCCSICLADYKETDVLLLLPNCAHPFHVHCVQQWLSLHPTCPICRNSPIPASFVVSIDHIMSLQNSEDQLER